MASLRAISSMKWQPDRQNRRHREGHDEPKVSSQAKREAGHEQHPAIYDEARFEYRP